MGVADIYHLSMGAFDPDIDYNQEFSYVVLKNIENLAVAGFKWRFQTSVDEAAITSDLTSVLSTLNSWADGAFAVGDKDSRDLPARVSQSVAPALNSLCLLLPPPFNTISMVVLQVLLEVLDSKLEAASDRAALEPIAETLEEIRDAINDGLQDSAETTALLARLSAAAESLRELGVSMTINEFGRLSSARLDFTGLSADESGGE